MMLSKFIGITEEANHAKEDKPRPKTYKIDVISDESSISTCSKKPPLKRPASTTVQSDTVEKWFQTMDTRTVGKINAKELQQAFETFQGRHFSDAVCKFVVRLFDLDKNGGLDVREFEQLYSYVKQWVQAFSAVDRSKTGFLDETQFDSALKEMDIQFSTEFIKFLISRNDPSNRKMTLDQFIVTCIQIQRFSDEFKQRDTNFTGNINLKYEDFLEMIMKCL